jgi:hypothetical protein
MKDGKSRTKEVLKIALGLRLDDETKSGKAKARNALKMALGLKNDGENSKEKTVKSLSE